MIYKGNQRLGDFFSSRRENGIAGMPTLSITLDRGAVERDSIDRKMETNLSADEHLLGKAGDIAYNMMRMWQGASGFIENDGLLSPAYVVLAPKKNINSKYAAYLFKSPRILYLFWAYSYGLTSDRLRLYFNDFKKIPVEIPPLSEQTKIANFLTAIDEKITQLTQKCDLLAQYKKGVMQQIFSQKLRFKDDDGREFPEWKKRKIGELGRFIGGGTPTTQNDEFWNGNIPWISSSDLSDESIFQIKTTRFISEKAISQSATKLVPKNSILIVSRVGVGKVAIAKEDICTSQDFTNLVLHSGNHVFFAYLLKTKTNKLLEFNQGTSIKGFVKSDLEAFEIYAPVIQEQTKIANFLTAIDDKITQAQTQLDAVKYYKKGLLQQMFV